MIAFILNILCLTVVYAQNGEYEKKAKHISNFPYFVEWPEPVDTYVIGIYGNKNFCKFVKNNKNDLSFDIVYFSNLEDITACHILFIGSLVGDELADIVSFAKENAILTVGDDIDDFCKSGGIINFTKRYAGHQFAINFKMAKESKIKISSRLLVLAEIIN